MNTGNKVYGVCEVIHDPDPDGAFPDGAKLQGMYPMLRDGSFTPGTLLRVHGNRYMVLGAPGKPQALVSPTKWPVPGMPTLAAHAARLG